MEVDENTWKIIRQALKDWEANGRISEEQAAALRDDVQLKKDGRKQAATYFFFIAICSTLLAFGAIFINEKLLEKIKAYFSWSDLAISLIAALLAAIWLWYINKKKILLQQLMRPAWYQVAYWHLPLCCMPVKK